MKVRVSFVVDVDDRFRRALRLSENRAGLASRNEVKTWFRFHGDSDSDAHDLIDENLEPLEFMEEHDLVNPQNADLTEEEHRKACESLSEKRSEVWNEEYIADSKRIAERKAQRGNDQSEAEKKEADETRSKLDAMVDAKMKLVDALVEKLDAGNEGRDDD